MTYTYTADVHLVLGVVHEPRHLVASPGNPEYDIIYIYIYRERERYMCVYTYICIHT